MLTIPLCDADRITVGFYTVSLQADLLDGWAVVWKGEGSGAPVGSGSICRAV
jgi:hypothetical protein